MRPGHIRVFDGLRITTEHVHHLQGAMHSALQEIREILGLGRVYYGFEVVAETDQSIIVQPGLAFDSEKNRIACDEPRTVEVSFGPDEEAKFVCIKYDQIEDGQVEGQFTIVWDSCAVSLRTDMPEPEENIIPIAQLVKASEEDGDFEIIDLRSPEQDEESAQESREAETLSTEPSAEETQSAPVETTAPATDESNGNTSVIEGELAETAAHLVSTEKVNEEVSSQETEATGSAWPGWRLHVRQGVARLAADGSTGNIVSLIAGPLREKLNGQDISNDVELLFTLAEKEVASEFPVSSLSCQAIISAALAIVEEGSEEKQFLKCQSTAQGEATFTGEGISQFGITTIQPYSGSGQAGGDYPVSDLTERGIARLPLSDLWKRTESPSTDGHLFQPLQLLIRADKTNADGFKVVCNLLWKGAITAEFIRTIEAQKIDFTWDILLAWKTLGELQE
ncbi:MAG: hypothetical protein L0229_27235 [Blastocatellia bacterium]|nr:hypothetical protein [Blastocatellia bacterium]